MAKLTWEPIQTLSPTHTLNPRPLTAEPFYRGRLCLRSSPVAMVMPRVPDNPKALNPKPRTLNPVPAGSGQAHNEYDLRLYWVAVKELKLSY